MWHTKLALSISGDVVRRVLKSSGAEPQRWGYKTWWSFLDVLQQRNSYITSNIIKK